jgi:two-component system alkaline phosphatase synthesis response regulator PhoP
MKVIVVEDDAVVADTVRLYLEQAGHEVAVAHDGVTGLRLASAPDAAAVVLDLMIPGLSGLEVCRRLRAISTVPILMLTARVSEDDRLAGFEAGADDYVAKPFAPREIVARVQALLRRTAGTPSSVPPPPITIGGLEIDLWARQARVRSRSIGLTATEFKLLAALAAAPGRVFSREELVARVFGPDYEGLDRTIDVHVTNLRRKIEIGDEPRRIHTAHGLGYRLAGGSDA